MGTSPSDSIAAATSLDDDVAVILEDDDIEFEYVGGDTAPTARLSLGADDDRDVSDTYPGPARRAASDAAVDAHDQTLLKRQLSAARTEIQVLLNQLADFGKVRGQALARAYEVEALKARTVNLESEAGQLRDDLCAARGRMADMEATGRVAREAAQTREASAPRAQPEPAVSAALQAELEAARSALSAARSERDELATDAATLREAVRVLEARVAAQTADIAALGRQAEQVRALESAVVEAQADLIASRKRRAELELQIDELQQEIAGAQARAEEEARAGDDIRALEARSRELGEAVDDLTQRLAESEAAREEAFERAERTRVALERLRLAYGRAQEGEQQAANVATELEGLRSSNEVARQRIEALEREVAAERTRADSVAAGLTAEQTAVLAAERAELESRLERLEDELVRERRVSDQLGARADAAEARMRVHAASGEQAGGGPKTKEFEAELQRLRAMVHSSSTLIQRYLLELEGAKGAIARNRQEALRYAQRVSGLHEGIGHLYRYLEDAGPPAEQALVLLQGVKRSAGELRALAESNDRFGKAMERAMERLGQVLEDSPITR